MIGILESKRVYQPPVVFDFTQGIVGYWKLATDANDSSGLGHNGTPTGMTYSGGYAQFNTGKYIDVADSDDFSFTNGVNDLSAHILISFVWNTKTGSQVFMNKRGQTTQLEWSLNSNGTNVLFRLIGVNTSSYIQIAVPVSAISASVLHTLQFVYDGSESMFGLSAYLDGNNQLGSIGASGTYTGQTNGTSLIRMGNNTWFGTAPLKADAKEWAIWKSRTMTGAERQELHDRVIAGTPLI